MAGAHAIRVYRYAADVKAASLAALAAGKGVAHAPDYVTASSSGWCHDPIVLDEEGYGHFMGDTEPMGGWPSGQDGPGRRLRRALRRKQTGDRERVWTSDVPDWEPARTLSRQVRCRRCDGCRKERRCMWANRAVSEWKKAAAQGGRTWFVTLTFRQEEHYRLQTKARLRLSSMGGNLDALPWNDRYAEVLSEYHEELNSFLDRLRVGLATRGWKRAQFRYLAVPEPHKSADIRVHYHVLLHEAPDPKSREIVPLVRRRIEQAWRGDLFAAPDERGHRARRDLGFVQAKLVESPEGALYVTKYLGKHHYEGRIRVSKGYGAEGERDDEHELKQPAVPPPMTERKRPQAPPAPRADTPALAAGMLEATEEDDDTDPVRVGDFLGVCPSGLHIGAGCDCEPATDELECLPVEHDELRGTPRRKWPLRGWHETSPGGGGPRVNKRRSPADGESVH